MEKRIELECRGRNHAEIEELNLDNCKATSVDGLTDKFVNLEVLSLNNVGLTSLRHFPHLPKLRKLELSDNRISSGLEYLAGCPELTHLTLSNNRIKDLEALKVLADFNKLRSLDVYQCEVTAIDDYREKVFELIPQLEWLDSTGR
ncbi:acidic leucine-rich nuclear phosphoprotein 32 family member A-like [Corticium candelabrum]|uniref:acidic leucine-rich nuclear phosphoprotein 32 family member A-like n=1 Tax=Corticium candelabrum TaxID=121492 RepID=UPI002E275CE7|nr:acidic leucine-rich nuclear phosphoprotein 32 family member A-like [Corticium candelabrum]XP_062511938.1 acidic leucine-rich nuclear phosphoprotein 32 family member A-like [Corticium candelabrum]